MSHRESEKSEVQPFSKVQDSKGEFEEAEDGEEDDNDFVCIPINNIDNETMTFKRTEDFKDQLM